MGSIESRWPQMTKKPNLTISDALLKKLSALPDNTRELNRQKEKEIEAAVIQFYPKKSMTGIAEIFGVDVKVVKRIIVKKNRMT
jgi:hypothetical protein